MTTVLRLAWWPAWVVSAFGAFASATGSTLAWTLWSGLVIPASALAFAWVCSGRLESWTGHLPSSYALVSATAGAAVAVLALAVLPGTFAARAPEAGAMSLAACMLVMLLLPAHYVARSVRKPAPDRLEGSAGTLEEATR